MKQNKFKTGDLVRLKSGGPTMTVTGIPTDFNGEPRSMAYCQWFEGEKRQKDRFDENVLDLIS